MSNSELWVRGGQTYKKTNTQTDTDINTMLRPGLWAGPSEKLYKKSGLSYKPFHN